jgi:transposase
LRVRFHIRSERFYRGGPAPRPAGFAPHRRDGIQ